MRFCELTMRIDRNRFNTYLLACLTVVCCSGCHLGSGSKKNPIAELAVFMEVNPTMPEASSPVPIFRKDPVMINIEKTPFLTEYNVKEASVVEQHDSYDLRIKFDQQGTWLLEQYTTTNPGRHMAISCRFGVEHKEVRWLGAPLIRKRISDGVLTFTPDATLEETEEIVRELNNAAKQNEQRTKW